MLDPDLILFFEAMLEDEDKFIFEMLVDSSIENEEITNMLISKNDGGMSDHL